MSRTFMCVGELGGDCPIHGRRGSVHGAGAMRHACGCPMFKGETHLTGSDVLAHLANNQALEEELKPLTDEEKETFGLEEPWELPNERCESCGGFLGGPPIMVDGKRHCKGCAQRAS